MADTAQHVSELGHPRGPRGASPGGNRVLRLPWEELDAVNDRYLKYLTGCATRCATASPVPTKSAVRGVIRADRRVPHIQRPRSGNA